MSAAGRRRLIGEIHKEMEFVTERQIQEALAIQRAQGGLIGEIFVRLGYIAREELLLALAQQTGMTVTDKGRVNPEFLDGDPRETDAAELIFEGLRNCDIGEPLAESPPVVKLVNLVLITALKANATDVSFESLKENFGIRYRVDGIVYEMESPPRHLAAPVLSRLRHLTGLGPYEKRSATVIFNGRRYRVDAASLRTAAGETISLGFSPATPR